MSSANSENITRTEKLTSCLNYNFQLKETVKARAFSFLPQIQENPEQINHQLMRIKRFKRSNYREQKRQSKRKITIAIFNQKVKNVVITFVSELVIRRRQPLQTLSSNRREVAGELRILRQYHRPSCHKAIYERFLAHS